MRGTRRNHLGTFVYQQLTNRLRTIDNDRLHTYLRNARTGLEKESLRVTSEGRLSQHSHPAVLGSTLKHPWITTDYAEAMLELITPPQARATQALDFLLNIESFVYQHLDDELLWTTSMPCILGGADDIRIAEYGTSNAGQMKHIYRQGLAWRYGKTMQVISGVHFNYSVDEAFWPVWYEQENRADTADNTQNPLGLRQFRDSRYMGMTRNMQRYGWLVIYLFGSSPAICKSFLGDKPMPENMQVFNQNTLYEPHGTSLRMGNIGYTNSKEHEKGIRVCYDSVESYTQSLRQAIEAPCPEYSKIGVKVDGKYRQLNANTLQIENEYYSTVRPKQPLRGMEKPVDALTERGIEYIELRSVDINPFDPAGLTHRQLAFLEVFMHFCLLQDSPTISRDERPYIDENHFLVAHQGRKADLQLPRLNNATGQVGTVNIRDWANELLDNMYAVASILDTAHDSEDYRDAVEAQRELVTHSECTPSARVLEDMMANHESFFDFAQRKSQEHRDYFMKRKLSTEQIERFRHESAESLKQQKKVENNDELDFDTFLERYFAGKL